MRTVIETKEVYKYNELSDGAKEKAKEYILEHYRTPEDFSDMVKCDLENLFGVNNGLDFSYDFNYSQTDAFNIHGNIKAETILDFMDSDTAGELSKKYGSVLSDNDKNKIREWCKEYRDIHYNGIGIITLYQNYRVIYCMAEAINFADYWATELHYYDIEDTDILFTFEKACRDLFTELCEMYNDWGCDYFFEVNDEEMIEFCDANDIEFYDDGTVY